MGLGRAHFETIAQTESFFVIQTFQREPDGREWQPNVFPQVVLLQFQNFVELLQVTELLAL
jgi:hypothetical protein